MRRMVREATSGKLMENRQFTPGMDLVRSTKQFDAVVDADVVADACAGEEPVRAGDGEPSAGNQIKAFRAVSARSNLLSVG